ncbi:hypothetical protein WYY_05794 [Bacillus velezensis M27]|uniref:Uncharacterized protein n=1 Tax=Bacillus amyloliquefaciens (strain Y2) TaxID=1155777 RepID=I2C971_BACAY|nr:hypothetical protein MUS_3311 [Bacillus velezensis YAU B9601-Y2]AGZ57542.1 hypothetical protein U471_28440 [Bacillus amyloliquefaciens CC178]AHZ17038.1 hypothetical protein V529_30120 [Bacillus velezensis SQR9]ANF37755.1 hypothetical protein BCBMB205_28650 [Bacillus velezensis]EKE47715.1 hypothetical protein WYY_05794 [Bacillus velezensis M27]KYC91326.1 hypothetical protein B4140_2966 [Bacillus amyloliquefaciens]GFR55505.1 hypothetical protein MUS_3311 [Bacillus sp. CN2]
MIFDIYIPAIEQESKKLVSSIICEHMIGKLDALDSFFTQ